MIFIEEIFFGYNTSESQKTGLSIFNISKHTLCTINFNILTHGFWIHLNQKILYGVYRFFLSFVDSLHKSVHNPSTI